MPCPRLASGNRALTCFDLSWRAPASGDDVAAEVSFSLVSSSSSLLVTARYPKVGHDACEVIVLVKNVFCPVHPTVVEHVLEVEVSVVLPVSSTP